MPQMVRHGFFVAAMLAAGLFAAAPAHANTDCASAIRGAVAHKARVPQECWRIGPLTLGMTRRAAEDALGPPDLTGTRIILARRRRLYLDMVLYVFPRNLSSWLTLAPAAREDFHPVTLRLAYAHGALAAITFGRSARIDFPACTPQGKTGPGYRRSGVDFPANFNGVALGTSLKDVTTAFGPFATHNRSKDFWTYWPVPIAVDGQNTVQELDVAASMDMAGVLGPAHLAASLDLGTCRINGFSLPN